MANKTFLGFRQVSAEYYDGLTDSEKVGYLWFVRTIESGVTISGDIFLGTRQYAHFGGEVDALENRVNAILYNAGIIDESGNTINITRDYLTKALAEDIYVKKEQLFNLDDSGNVPLGVLVISGNDVETPQAEPEEEEEQG